MTSNGKRMLVAAVALSAAVLFFALLLNTWVVDDAYITFRSVDNFIHGHGLRWNIDERVQSYTHPLWMFLMIPFAAATGEFFYTSIFVSLALAIAAMVVSASFLTDRFRADLWKFVFFAWAIVASKAVLDYTSSGLENALLYLLAALFMTVFFRLGKPIHPADAGKLFVLATLSYVTRQDTLLLFLPALVYVLVEAGKSIRIPRLLLIIFIATLPATLWTAFSLFYYGYIFPNTSYAKLTYSGITPALRAARGWEYLVNSIQWDFPSYVILLGAAALAWKKRDSFAGRILVGIIFYYLYVVLAAASATHMSGRFFALPLFMAMLVCARLMDGAKIASAVTGLLILFAILNPISSLKYGTRFYHPFKEEAYCIDTKYWVGTEGAALINWQPGRKLPDLKWLHYGERVRTLPGKAQLCTEHGGQAIGFLGFAAGPDKFIVDPLGLGDALLAHIPADPIRFYWKSGHFARTIPDGYMESIEKNTNAIKDPKLHEYYGIIREITRGPLFSMHRMKLILNMNLGKYRHLTVK
ncbi:hypothetical protein LLG95_01045 [bacterium]|nr:hypothetical protein [bacterium]